MQLRPYQKAAIDSVLVALTDNPASSPCAVLPTGAGKSVIMAGMLQQWLANWPAMRVCVLAHVKELVEQNYQKLKRAWPGADAGLYSAGLGKRDTDNAVIFASIQSVHKKALHLGAFDLILIDEAHRIPLSGDGMYRRFLVDAKKACPWVRVVGLTATPYRLGAGLVVGPQNILTDVCFEVSVKRLIDQGYLSPLVSKGGHEKPDLQGISVSSGEFKLDELEARFNASRVVESAVQEALELSAGRKRRIWFTAGHGHAVSVAAELERQGVRAPVVTDKTPAGERARIVEQFKTGHVSDLVNIAIFTEGFDVPALDCVVLMRATMSAGLYCQMVGRGLRLAPGKQNCLVLDYGGNIERHGPIDSVKVKKKRKRGESATTGAPVKECPECQTMNLLSAVECEDCGYGWPETPAHSDTASGASILSSDEWLEVGLVEYGPHSKGFGTRSVIVHYYSPEMMPVAREWLCFEHSGHARVKAVQRWRYLTGGERAPATVEEALERQSELAPVQRVLIRQGGKYPEVLEVTI